MKLKLTILTIMVTLLAVLSWYGVSGKRRSGAADYALLQAAADNSFNSQTAYLLPISEPNNFPIRQPEAIDPVLSAKAYLLYETKTGKILLAKNSKQPLPIASLTKLLTAVLAVENLSLREAITINETMRNVDGEGADFYRGEKILVKDLLAAMLIKSSNDAAVALAETVAKKKSRPFTEIMNEKAASLGMSNSLFVEAAGLRDDGYSTVEDLLKLVKYVRPLELIWGLTGLRSWEMRSADGQFAHSFLSTNKLWGVIPGIISGKTGYTDGALGCMILEVGLKEANQGSLLAIVLGSPARFEDTRKLIEWGQASFRWK